MRTLKGIGVLRALIDERDPSAAVPQSVFETELFRLLKKAGLGRPVTQHEVRERGRLLAVVDFAYPDARFAIEADGYRWHSGKAQWERDLRRRNALTKLGWQVIHVTWSELREQPERVVATIEAALTAARTSSRRLPGS